MSTVSTGSGWNNVQDVRTLRDHIEATRVRTHPPEYDDVARYERLYAIRIDDTTLGDIDLGTDREVAKRRDEIHALGYALIGCEADLELASIRSLAPRPGRCTPDFEATTVKDQGVRIEVVRMVDPNEKKIIAALQAFGRCAEDELLRLSDAKCLGAGTIHVRFCDGVPDIRSASRLGVEFGTLLAAVVPGSPYTTILHPIGDEKSYLASLGVRWARDKADGPPRVLVDLPIWLDFRESTLASFDEAFAAKAAKAGEYRDGLPTWLVMYVDTRMFLPLATIQSLAGRKDFDPRPFDRVLAGCFTAGVIFETGLAPRYTSLTSPPTNA